MIGSAILVAIDIFLWSRGAIKMNCINTIHNKMDKKVGQY